MINSYYDDFNNSLRMCEKFYNPEMKGKQQKLLDYQGDDEENQEWHDDDEHSSQIGSVEHSYNYTMLDQGSRLKRKEKRNTLEL